MVRSTAIIVRAFDGSLTDAEGLLAVERATFDESPYSAEQVRAMLSHSPQRGWLAWGEGKVVGFVTAFPTHGLRGVCWEVDLLAVHPNWTGRGLATRLVRAASVHGLRVACQARAVVATDNVASARAFAHTGFRSEPETCKLLIYRTEEPVSRTRPVLGISVREAASVAEAKDWLASSPTPFLCKAQSGPRAPGQLDHSPAGASGESGPTLLLAEQDSQPAGYAELIEVQTLLYHGVWIESLVASARRAREALVHHAVEWARAAGLDEIGAMVRESNRPLQESLLAGGFRSLGDFHWLTVGLPLPGEDHV